MKTLSSLCTTWTEERHSNALEPM